MPRAKIRFEPLSAVISAEPSTPGQRAIAALLCPSIEPDELVAQAVSNQRAVLHLAAQVWLHKRHGHPPKTSLPRDIRPIILCIAEILELERRAAADMTSWLRAENPNHPYANEWEMLADLWRSRRDHDRTSVKGHLLSPEWRTKADGPTGLSDAIAALTQENEEEFSDQPFYALLVQLTKRGTIARSHQVELRKAWRHFHSLAARSPAIQNLKIVDGKLAYRGRGGRIQWLQEKGNRRTLAG